MVIKPVTYTTYSNRKQSSNLSPYSTATVLNNPNTELFKNQLAGVPASYNIISFKGAAVSGVLKKVAASKHSPLWEKLISRETSLYKRTDDLRSEFTRDYDRILHSDAYNKMSGKTQVFSHPKSDTTSTRIHHVNQVASIAEDLARHFGLNVELTRAIAVGHDVGHTPFGHGGERALSAIMKSNNFDDAFWHEKNSLRFIDDIETKLDPQGAEKNLDLTYAVRDGIISHCGEVDENGLRPRTEYIDLRTIKKNNRPQPFTWEGCVVKISDKIAYLGKDLEDAVNNKFLKPEKLEELRKIVKADTGLHFDAINNTVLINHFISDLRKNSSLEKGLCFSEPAFKLMNTIKKFNYENIYLPKDKIQGPYYDLSINTVFNTLDSLYDGKNTLTKLNEVRESKPILISGFSNWLVKYSNVATEERVSKKYANKIIYDIENPKDYKQAIIEYTASLTDRGLKKSFDEIIFFG
ncbi:MAG: HD domain-containing protein [Candidatus Gastranaerophilales bacterium]|nr:HD domain-containing protein [Candidatus Gastranaerophilales bacterium]